MMKEIVLTTINAKWIHPSLALRLLKANLGSLEDSCEIIEFALRQPLSEKTEQLLAASPKILGISVSIWNHLATIELLEELGKLWTVNSKPVIVLGGPEISYLPHDAKIFKYADYIIRGEGETAFGLLCEEIIFTDYKKTMKGAGCPQEIIADQLDNVSKIKYAYYLYTNEDLEKKLIYVESSRGCVFNCEFCLSAVKKGTAKKVREFPLEPFLAQMDKLVKRGAKTFKFLDRSINTNIPRLIQICEFFLEKIEQHYSILVHFEMVPSILPPQLCEILSRFPSGTLRLEIGIQTLNPEISAQIGRPANSEKELEVLRFLRQKTNAIVHVDLIAGLPGEDIESFGRGFDRLWLALGETNGHHIEIQLGILKLLPGAPICRHSETFKMQYNPIPPYEVMQTSVMSANDVLRIKNFARFWEIIVNRGLADFTGNEKIFNNFLVLSDSLLLYFGKNWGIDKNELLEFLKCKNFGNNENKYGQY